MKLVIAGPVSRAHREYFNRQIRPFIDNSNIRYVGEVDFETKVKIYGKAIATLFPIQWNEPFGIVMLESMACGTPVVAFNRAAVGEVIRNGVNGYIVQDSRLGAMAKAIDRAAGLDRKKVREYTGNIFDVKKQSEIYEQIIRRSAVLTRR